MVTLREHKSISLSCSGSGPHEETVSFQNLPGFTAVDAVIVYSTNAMP